jgi:hypothetical protein
MAPFALLLPCLAGMGIGLAIDCTAVDPDALASLCSSDGGILARVALHWRVMPAAHGLMLAGAVLACVLSECTTAQAGTRKGTAIAARIGAHVACLLAMCAGMAIGAPIGAEFGGVLGLSSFIGMTAAMVAGMAVGVGLTAPLLRNRQECRIAPAQSG